MTTAKEDEFSLRYIATKMWVQDKYGNWIKKEMPPQQPPKQLEFDFGTPVHQYGNVERDEVGQSFEEIAMTIASTLVGKNKAYGNAFEDSGKFLKLLYPDGIKPEQYTDVLLIARIFDKLKRVANRTPGNKDLFDESPYMDIAGYAILGTKKDIQNK